MRRGPYVFWWDRSPEDASMISSTSALNSESTPTTGRLLTCGAIAGPLFIVVALLQAFVRDGFDVSRHPVSMLALGDTGWIQIANFIITGALFVACAVGLRRVLHPGRGGTWGPLLIGLFGMALIGGGVFLSDPALGFPPGTPEGPPANLSAHGILHGIAFGIGMLSLIAAFFVFARRFAAAHDRGWSRYSMASGVTFIVLFVAGMTTNDFRILGIAIIVGWMWASLVAVRLQRTARLQEVALPR
jgi:hypothetical protein